MFLLEFKKILFLFFLFLFFFTFSPSVSAVYSPNQIKAAYNLPQNGGLGKTVAIIAPGFSGVESDLNTFSDSVGIPRCTQSNGCLTIHEIYPNPYNSASIETALDTQWVHAIAPEAKIILVTTGGSGGLQGLSQAIQFVESRSDVDILSMSFGNDIDNPSNCSLFTNPNITRFASSGDDGPSVGWPSLCPQVISVGGTKLIMSGNNFVSENVWSPEPCGRPNGRGWCATGGGLSSSLSEPSYQSSYNIPQANGHRGTPDVSSVASGNPGGYMIYKGSVNAAGGTSWSAPIWAGVAALSSGIVTHELLYNNAASSYSNYFRDITLGCNDTANCNFYKSAQSGYDYVTGLGSPLGLPTGSGTTPPPTASPTPTGAPLNSPTPTVTSVPSSYSVFGSAFRDVNGNSKRDPGEELTGLRVNLSKFFTTTNQSGDYSFPNLIGGAYNLSFVYNGTTYNYQDNPIIFPNSQGYTSEKVDFILADTGIPVIVNPTPTPTPTPTPPPTPTGGGSGGASPTPSPTPIVTYKCDIDPNCPKGQKNLQLCPLICTPN